MHSLEFITKSNQEYADKHNKPWHEGLFPKVEIPKPRSVEVQRFLDQHLPQVNVIKAA